MKAAFPSPERSSHLAAASAWSTTYPCFLVSLTILDARASTRMAVAPTRNAAASPRTLRTFIRVSVILASSTAMKRSIDYGPGHSRRATGDSARASASRAGTAESGCLTVMARLPALTETTNWQDANEFGMRGASAATR